MASTTASSSGTSVTKAALKHNKDEVTDSLPLPSELAKDLDQKETLKRIHDAIGENTSL